MARNDIHSPKNIVTENYEFVCVKSYGQGIDNAEFNRIGTEQFNAHRAHTGGIFSQHQHGGDCMICGSWFIDYAIFYYAPTNEYISCGMDCAGHIEEGHDAAFKRQAQLRRAAMRRTKARAKAAEFLESINILDFVERMYRDDDLLGVVRDRPNVTEDSTCFDDAKDLLSLYMSKDVIEAMTKKMIYDLEGKFWILVEMTRKLEKYEWSDKQTAFAKSIVESFTNAKENALKWRKEHEALDDVQEGRYEIQGVVVSVKWQESNFSYYGESTRKLTIKTDAGNVLFGTCPASIYDAEKGDVVKMTATMAQGSDDPKFGLWKRPSKAEIVEKKEK